tara:strand:+ start:1129 stop:1521 length:393 start_codon:yes stop_codon:yes gene_type:complete
MLALPLSVISQTWIDDSNFEDKINPGSAFGDDESTIVVVEFWAKFNQDNAFAEWKKLDDLPGVRYYRIDIATSPRLTKELRIRMAPTLLIYIKGDAYIKFKAKAGLDLLCPVDYPKMLRAIEVVKQESRF